MHCHLFVPEFFAADALPSADRFAAAETLVARGRRKRHDAISPEGWLFGRFDVEKQRDWPVAPYTLLGDGGSPGTDTWLRADPVHLRAGSEGLMLVDVAPSGIARDEADALADALNRHFGETLLLQPLQPSRWYLRLQPPTEVETTPPAAALGRPVAAHLARGRDALRLHALMNEAQMLLHEHPVNVAREARGEAPLNSLWPWGGGAIVAAMDSAIGGAIGATAARPFSMVIADDPLARGLALAAGISVRPLPASAELLHGVLAQKGVALVVMNAPRDAGGAATLERDWFAPLLAALQARRIGMLSLHLFGAETLLEVETVRSDLRYLWRRRAPLARYLA
jgi:hypothetical protein